jgi:pyruvate dehydrogenase (quinone)
MESVSDLVIRTALSARGSRTSQSRAVQVQEVKRDDQSTILHHTSAVPADFERLPARIELEHAADILNCGERVIILTGERDLHAKEDLEEVVGTPIV